MKHASSFYGFPGSYSHDYLLLTELGLLNLEKYFRHWLCSVIGSTHWKFEPALNGASLFLPWLLVKSYWNVDMLVVCESRTQRQSGIPSFSHHPPRLVNSRVTWWILAALVSLKKNILVIEKVQCINFHKAYLEDTWEKDGFSQSWIWGRSPSYSPSQQCRCMSLNGIWGQLECCSWGVGLGCRFTGAAGLLRLQQLFCQILRELATGPVPQQELPVAEWDTPIWRSPAKWVVCCQSPGSVPDLLFAQSLMNSAKRKNILIMNWAEWNNVLQINGNETEPWIRKMIRKQNATRGLLPVNKHGKRLERPWILNSELKKISPISPATRQLEDSLWNLLLNVLATEVIYHS